MSRPILKGSTSQSTAIRFLDATTGQPVSTVDHATAGLSLWYRRAGGLVVSFAAASLAALDSAYTSGGIEPMTDGWSRVDLPNAAIASAAGVNDVIIGGSATGVVGLSARHPLWDVDPQNSATFGLSAFYRIAVKKNTAYTEVLRFEMLLSGGTSPATGITPTVTRSIDGATAAAADAGTTVAEIAGGVYAFTNIAAADLNGDDIMFIINGSGCKTTLYNFKTLA